MKGPLLETLWKIYYEDSQVKHALQEMVKVTDKKLVQLIRLKTSNLSPKAISESLRRLEIQIKECPSPVPGPNPVGGSLEEIIRAGLISPPLELFRNYKGSMLKAILKHDGALEFQGKLYKTCSGAAVAATGKPTDGWNFWQYLSGDGKNSTLKDLRKKFTLGKGKVG
jgi:hypothetical protein